MTPNKDPNPVNQTPTLPLSRWIWLIRLALYPVIHIGITFSCFLLSHLIGMRRFDNPELPVGILEKVLGFIGGAMLHPIDFALNYLHLRPINSAVEWLIIYFNAIIWGLPFVYGWARLTTQCTRTVPLRGPAGDRAR